MSYQNISGKLLAVNSIFSVIIMFLLLGWIKGVCAAPSPALDPFPSSVLDDYFVCSATHEANNSINRYNAIASWFESFSDSDIYKSVDNISELIEFETLTNLVVLIRYSKDNAFSDCKEVTFYLLEKAYEQANLAYEWIQAKEFTSETEVEMNEMTEKGNQLRRDIERAFEQFRKLRQHQY